MVRRKNNARRTLQKKSKKIEVEIQSVPSKKAIQKTDVTSTSKVDETRLRRRKSNMKNMTVIRDGLTGEGMTRGMYKCIKRLQSSTEMLIPKLSFARLVREIIMSISPAWDWRIQSDALNALQESCELYMTQYFEDSYSCTLHAKRRTLNIRDMQLARRIRGREDTINH